MKDLEKNIRRLERLVVRLKCPLLSYTLTRHNIIRILRLLYRIHSNVPVILMGETGSGKSYTINFLADVAGRHIKQVRYVIDGGTTEDILRDFIRDHLNKLTAKRQKMLMKLISEWKIDKVQPRIFRDFLVGLEKLAETAANPDRKFITMVEAHHEIEAFVRGIDRNNNYQIVEAQLDSVKLFLRFHVGRLFSKLDDLQKHLLFFFDEVNTAPCQWFLKEVMIDRYFEGQILPSYVRFICAVNPWRQIEPAVEAKFKHIMLPPGKVAADRDVRSLVYKVHRMPESFQPFVLPADPNRVLKDNRLDSLDRCEFEYGIQQMVFSGFAVAPEKFTDVPKRPLADGELWGDSHHFWESERYTIAFSQKFFRKALADPATLNIDEGAIEKSFFEVRRLVAQLCIYSCRLLSKEYYRDDSFTSLREAVNLVNLMRYMFRFGLSEAFDSGKWKADVSRFARKADECQKRAVWAFKRMRDSLLMALTAAFWLRLMEHDPDKDQHVPSKDRTDYIQQITKFWSANDLSRDLPAVVRDNFKAPTEDDWQKLREHEFEECAKMFVEEGDGISLNEALTENAWAAYTCVLNHIHLWIIGKPGTSKSLAVNKVLKKLSMGRGFPDSSNGRLAGLPRLVYQMYMCSDKSTSQAILDQLHKVVIRGRMKHDQHVIQVQILEEMGHADMSPYLPLKCLHNVIDNGIELQDKVFVRVVLVGISNYNMDRAKLNRGILIFRDEMGDKQLSKTSIDIAVSTIFAIHKAKQSGHPTLASVEREFGQDQRELLNKLAAAYQSMKDHILGRFVGFRDLYGLLRLWASIELEYRGQDQEKEKRLRSAILRNFSGPPDPARVTQLYKLFLQTFSRQYNEPETVRVIDLIRENIENPGPRELKMPLMRHILIGTEYNAALSGLGRFWRDATYIFPMNLTDLPDTVWASNDLRKFAKRLRRNGGAVVFVGSHTAFDALYDVFNQYYNEAHGSQKTSLSYAGSSFSVPVDRTFRCVIVLDDTTVDRDSEYRRVPPPFLNRFEKFAFRYRDALPTKWGNLPQKMQERCALAFGYGKDVIACPFRAYFGCYCPHHFEACAAILAVLSRDWNLKDLDVLDFALLSCHPSTLLHRLFKCDFGSGDETFKELGEGQLRRYSVFHSSIANLINGYGQEPGVDTPLISLFLHQWHSKESPDHYPGIQAVVMVPSDGDIETLKVYGDLSDIIELDESFGLENRLKSAMDPGRWGVASRILLILRAKNPDAIRDYILQVEYFIDSHRLVKPGSDRKPIEWLHTIIVLNMEVIPEKLGLTQSVNWPVFYMDGCGNLPTIPTTSELRLDFNQLVFTPIIELIRTSVIQWEEVIPVIFVRLTSFYSNDENELVNEARKSDEFSQYLPNFLETRVADGDKPVPRFDSLSNEPNWVHEQIRGSADAPASALEFLEGRLLDLLATAVGMLFRCVLSGLDGQYVSAINQDRIEYIMRQDGPEELLKWAMGQRRRSFMSIETRYRCSPECLYPLYLLVWDFSTSHSELSDPDGLRGALDEYVFNGLPADDPEKIRDRRNFMRDGLAAYLLRDAPGLTIPADRAPDFQRWILCLEEILDWFYPDHPSMEELIFSLTDYELQTAIRSFTRLYRFVPAQPPKDRVIIDGNPAEQLVDIQGALLREVHNAILSAKFPSLSDARQFFTAEFPSFVSLFQSLEFKGSSSGEKVVDFKIGYVVAMSKLLCLPNLELDIKREVVLSGNAFLLGGGDLQEFDLPNLEAHFAQTFVILAGLEGQRGDAAGKTLSELVNMLRAAATETARAKDADGPSIMQKLDANLKALDEAVRIAFDAFLVRIQTTYTGYVDQETPEAWEEVEEGAEDDAAQPAGEEDEAE